MKCDRAVVAVVAHQSTHAYDNNVITPHFRAHLGLSIAVKITEIGSMRIELLGGEI